MADLPQPLELPADAPEPDITQELERRIAALEAERESSKLSHEAQLRELLMSEIRQRIWVRWSALGFAVIISVAMAALLVWASTWYFFFVWITVPAAYAIVMFAAPIASITAITITLVVGAFRRKGEDIDGNPMANLAGEVFKSASGSGPA